MANARTLAHTGRIGLGHILAAEPVRHPDRSRAAHGPASRLEQAALSLLNVARLISSRANWTDHMSAARLGIEVASLFEEVLAKNGDMEAAVHKFLYGFASKLLAFGEDKIGHDGLVDTLTRMVEHYDERFGSLDNCLQRLPTTVIN